MITIMPAEPGTLSFHVGKSGVYTRTVIAFSIQSEEKKYDSKYTVAPVDSHMVLDESEWVAVYHPSTKQVVFFNAGTFSVMDSDEALALVKDSIEK